MRDPPRSGAASASTRRTRRRRWAALLPGGARFGTVRSGSAAAAQAQSKPPRARKRLRREPQPSSRRSSCSGIAGLPQSRRCANVQSSVTISPFAPAPRARSMQLLPSARACPASRSGRTSAGWPRPPPRSACSRTSSAPSRCPRAAAARATATSPPGWTAWTPVGEMITGIEMLLAHHGGRLIALGGQAGGDARHEARARRTPSTLSLERRRRAPRRRAARRRPTWAAASAPGAAPRRPTRTSPLAIAAPSGFAPEVGERVSSHARSGGGRREWSTGERGDGAVAERRAAASPWPSTHSGSGPSSGSPVKNFAAMQPPRQESK